MTLVRQMSVAALLVLAPAEVMAADASPPPPVHPSPQAEERRETGAALPSPLAEQPLESLSATREHPLFSPTRRPPPPPPAVAAAPEPPPPPPSPPDVALFGIVMDGDEVRAVVRAGSADKITRVRIGDDIGGWKVAQIVDRRLVLALGGRIATFTMFAGNSAHATPASGSETPASDMQSQTQPQNQLQENPPAPATPPSLGNHRLRTPR